MLEKFMRACNVDFRVAGSRVPSLVDCLIDLNNSGGADDALVRIIEAAADPRDFPDNPERLVRVVEHLNQALSFDGLELRRTGRWYKLVQAGKAGPIVESLASKIETIDFDTVQMDLDRALDSAESDPEDALTAACSCVESVCRSILAELDLPLPAKKDIGGLYKAVREPLGLSTGRADLPPAIAGDVQKVMSGLISTVEGIGSLRTHAGDAHGRERGVRRVDPRIARLAIHAASTVALFFIETWQRKYPSKTLRVH